MSLFADCERTRRIPLPHRSTHFEGLNELADPEFASAREPVSRWLDQIAEDERDDLRTRLASDDDGRHQAALSELHLHAVLLAMGYRWNDIGSLVVVASTS